ncbi:MAG: hypothetical protein K2X91_08230, partial [Thermoleophilia bacterium]|nr:hypothetical protein [Thermoleophilia bacterium]
MRAAEIERRDDEGAADRLRWLRRQEAFVFDRLDQLAEEATSVRAYEARRARVSWDDDRRLDAEEAARHLAR